MTVYDSGRVDIDESAYSSSNFPVLPPSGTYKYIPVQNITGSAGQMVSNFVQDANGYQEFVNIPLGLYDTVGWKGGYYFIWAHKFSATKGEEIKEDYIYVGDPVASFTGTPLSGVNPLKDRGPIFIIDK